MAAGVAGRRGRGEWLLRFCFTQPLLVWSLLRSQMQSPGEGIGLLDFKLGNIMPLRRS